MDTFNPCENVQPKCALEHTLKGSFFGSLSVRSNSNCAYAHTAIERMLKGLFFGSLSICSKGHFLGP